MLKLLTLQVFVLLVCAWGLAALVLTISRSAIFRPLRGWLHEHDVHGWLSNLISCPYCLSHWVAAGWLLLAPFCAIRLDDARPLVNWIITWLFLVASTAWMQGVIFAQISGVYSTDTKEDL